MAKLKLYLSGPIKGLDRADYMKRFDKAEEWVRVWCAHQGEFDYEIVNPARLPQVQSSWADYLIRDLMLLKECHLLVMLPDWQMSFGCAVENQFAKGMQMNIIEIE